MADDARSDVRDRMVSGAMALLAERGLQATSFSEVLAATGAPRGSLYHHFPEGKDQLVAAAIDRAGALLADAMGPAGAPAAAVVGRFVDLWRALLARSDCEAGCAVLSVAVATDSPDLLMHVSAVFRGWRELLADLLHRGGLAPEQSRRFALLMIASIEGAVVLSRADRDLEPFEIVAQQLVQEVRRLTGA